MEYRPKNEICPLCGSGTHCYGGGWSCNDFNCPCNTENNDGYAKSFPEWWKLDLTIEKDGDMWCAKDKDFVNLQESKAGFGKTPREAVEELLKSK